MEYCSSLLLSTVQLINQLMGKQTSSVNLSTKMLWKLLVCMVILMVIVNNNILMVIVNNNILMVIVNNNNNNPIATYLAETEHMYRIFT